MSILNTSLFLFLFFLITHPHISLSSSVHDHDSVGPISFVEESSASSLYDEQAADDVAAAAVAQFEEQVEMLTDQTMAALLETDTDADADADADAEFESRLDAEAASDEAAAAQDALDAAADAEHDSEQEQIDVSIRSLLSLNSKPKAKAAAPSKVIPSAKIKKVKKAGKRVKPAAPSKGNKSSAKATAAAPAPAPAASAPAAPKTALPGQAQAAGGAATQTSPAAAAAAAAAPAAPAAPAPATDGGCPDEAKRRVNVCVKLLAKLTRPDSHNTIKLPTTLNHCNDPSIHNNAFSTTLNACNLIQMHILSVQPILTTFQALRDNDVHNVCVYLLSTPVRGQSFLAAREASTCLINTQPLNGNEGLTGFRCLFLGGSGLTTLKYPNDTKPGAFDGFLRSYPLYWGGLEKSVLRKTGLCDPRFFVVDSTTRAWSDPTLQADYCGAIKKFMPHVVFAHSSANLVLAAGIAHGIDGCEHIVKTSLDAKSSSSSGATHWYGIDAPLVGSAVAETLRYECANISRTIPPFYATCCDTGKNRPYKGYSSLRPVYFNRYYESVDPVIGITQLDCQSPTIKHHWTEDSIVAQQCIDAKEVAARYMLGSMCGVSPYPVSDKAVSAQRDLRKNWLNWPTAAVDFDVDFVTQYRAGKISGNDGFVSFQSCRLPSDYGLAPNSLHYAVRGNHDDGRCANGDSNTDVAKQPCRWITNRLQESKQLFTTFGGFKFGGRQDVKAAPQPSSKYQPFSSFVYNFASVQKSLQKQTGVTATPSGPGPQHFVPQ